MSNLRITKVHFFQFTKLVEQTRQFLSLSSRFCNTYTFNKTRFDIGSLKILENIQIGTKENKEM